MGGTVVAHDPRHDDEPGLAVVVPGLGDPAALLGLVELVAPVGDTEGTRCHAELEELARLAGHDGGIGGPAPEAVPVGALEHGPERRAGRALDPLTTRVLR